MNKKQQAVADKCFKELISHIPVVGSELTARKKAFMASATLLFAKLAEEETEVKRKSTKRTAATVKNTKTKTDADEEGDFAVKVKRKVTVQVLESKKKKSATKKK